MTSPSAPNPAAYHSDFPAFTDVHLRDARLYANRHDLIEGLGLRSGAVVAEVGVAFGHFSKVLIETLHPAEFVAIDTFELHKVPMMWGRPSADVFKGATHRAYYAAQLQDAACRVTVRQGFSHVCLAEFPDDYFDLIYLDADHSYEAVKADADTARQKLRPDGILVFNDYIMFDHIGDAPYGVVPVVNTMVVQDGWRVLGFALQHQLFCDIAIGASAPKVDPPVAPTCASLPTPGIGAG